MAGNSTFESASASSCKLGFSESYLNGQRRVRSAAVARGGSGALVPSDGFRTLSQCISLETVVIPEKMSYCDELSRVLAKPLNPMAAVKDLKRFRSSVEDGSFQARIRVNKLDGWLCKLDKFYERLTSKKQKKIYSVNERIEDRPKNVHLNKRARTSVAESRAKDGNLVEENGGESDLLEKIRRLAAGGEGWDKKIKRKRSVGITRSIDSDEVLKKALQNKVADERFRSSNRDDSLSNHKRPMPPSGSSSTPVNQRVGQRPQKNAQVRRPNLVPPVSNQDENRLSFDSHSPSDVGARLASQGTNGNGSLTSKIATTSTQKLILQLEKFQSRLSESLESVEGQSQLIGKEFGNSEKDEILKNKPLFNAATPNPFQKSKTGHKKNESKPVRRLKKLSDRKGLSRHSPLQNNSSPDCIGASDDDREELLAAANYARKATHLACSSPLWKKMEPVFASVSFEDKSFLSQEVDSVSNHMQHQEKCFSKKHDVDKTSNESIPLYQRVLSALIIEDDIDTLEEGNARNTCNLNGFEPRSRGSNSFKSSTINNIREDINSEVNLLTGFSKNGPQRYEEMCVYDDKLLLELQSIGIYPDIMPPLHDEENDPIQNEIDKLKTQLHQQEDKKKTYLKKICKQVESDTGSRDLETTAMDRLVELSCRKLQQANRRNPRSGIPKVPKQAALDFGRRTLARCHKFKNSGTSCFNEPPFQERLFAPVENSTKLLFDETSALHEPLSKRGKKKEILLNDVGTTKSRKPKPKLKPRQKTGQIPKPANGSSNKLTGSTHPTGPTWPTPYRRDIQAVSQDKKDVNDPANPTHNDFDPLDELGIGGPQDLNSFLNFDEQDPELDFAGGLDIPMDDLTDLF